MAVLMFKILKRRRQAKVFLLFCAIGGAVVFFRSSRSLVLRRPPAAFMRRLKPVVQERLKNHGHDGFDTKPASDAFQAATRDLRVAKRATSGTTSDAGSFKCGGVQPSGWIECSPDADSRSCRRRRCCWLALPPGQAVRSSCMMPVDRRRYGIVSHSSTTRGMELELELIDLAADLSGESRHLTVDVIRFAYDTARLRVRDISKPEFEPPVPKVSLDHATAVVGYNISLDTKGALRIVRKGGPHNSLTAHVNSVFYADGLKQLAIEIPSARLLYGLRGGDGAAFANASQWSKHTFYKHKSPNSPRGVFASVDPFMVAVTERADAALGVFLLNGNDVEMTLGPKGMATFRTSGGLLDLFVFFGADPSSVVKRYLRVVGFPALPSTRLVAKGVPLEGPLRSDGRVPAGGAPGVQEPSSKTVQFTDPAHPLSVHRWMDYLQPELDPSNALLLQRPRCRSDVASKLGVDGGETSDSDKPTDEGGTTALRLSSCRDMNNAYTTLLARATYRSSARESAETPRLLTEDTFPGSSRWSGYWNPSLPKDPDSRKHLVQDMLIRNMLGTPSYGVATCNLTRVTSPKKSAACIRLATLAVFLPVSSTLSWHSRDKNASQTPLSDTASQLEVHAKAAAVRREQLLAYTMTQLFESSRNGAMLARPMSFEFPDDVKAHTYTTQFMYGPHVLVAPPMESLRAPFEVYFPRSTVWYEWRQGRRITGVGQRKLVRAGRRGAPATFYRGGAILPELHKQRNITLIVALDADEVATGKLFYVPKYKADLGTVPRRQYSLFQFVYVKGMLAGHCLVCAKSTTIASVRIYGLPRQPEAVDIDGRPLAFNSTGEVVTIWDLAHNALQPFLITVT